MDDLYVMDRYNRLICVVFVDYNSTHVLNVNKWLIENGYAQITDYENEFDPNTWTLYNRKICKSHELSCSQSENSLIHIRRWEERLS